MMEKQAEKLGWIKGMSFRRNRVDKVTLSHILYADDTLLLCEVDTDKYFILERFWKFLKQLWLKVNLAKSSIFSINADDPLPFHPLDR